MSYQVPDFINPIVGYRFWYPFSGPGYNPDGYLHSLNNNHHLWPIDQPMVARPTDWSFNPYACWSGGIHAFKTKERLMREHYGIFGEVWLWGRIEEHAEGYRAEFAYPKRLFTTHGEKGTTSSSTVTNLAKRYGIATEEQSEWTLVNIVKPYLSNRWKQHRLDKLNNLQCRRHHNRPPLSAQSSSPNTSPWGRRQLESMADGTRFEY